MHPQRRGRATARLGEPSRRRRGARRHPGKQRRPGCKRRKHSPHYHRGGPSIHNGIQRDGIHADSSETRIRLRALGELSGQRRHNHGEDHRRLDRDIVHSRNTHQPGNMEQHVDIHRTGVDIANGKHHVLRSRRRRLRLRTYHRERKRRQRRRVRVDHRKRTGISRHSQLRKLKNVAYRKPSAQNHDRRRHGLQCGR